MSKTRSLAITLAALAVGISVGSAHPGHGEFGQGGSARHLLTEPLHLLPWALVVVFAVSAFLSRRRRNARRS